MISEHDLDLLDLYLRGDLTELEKETLEFRLTTDTELRSEWELMQNLKASLKLGLKNDFEELLKSIEREYNQQDLHADASIEPKIIDIKREQKKYSFLSIAATFLTLIAAASLIYFAVIKPDVPLGNELADGKDSTTNVEFNINKYLAESADSTIEDKFQWSQMAVESDSGGFGFATDKSDTAMINHEIVATIVFDNSRRPQYFLKNQGMNIYLFNVKLNLEPFRWAMENGEQYLHVFTLEGDYRLHWNNEGSDVPQDLELVK